MCSTKSYEILSKFVIGLKVKYRYYKMYVRCSLSVNIIVAVAVLGNTTWKCLSLITRGPSAYEYETSVTTTTDDTRVKLRTLLAAINSR